MSGTETTGGRILVVDDEEDFRSVVIEHLEDLGHRASGAGQAEKAMALARRTAFDVALIDLRMPGLGGLELLEALKAQDPGMEVVIITGHATVETAVKSMKRGAYDYLLKPCRLAQLEAVVTHALEKRRLTLEREKLHEQIQRTEPPANLTGQSEAIQGVRFLIQRAAQADSTILIEGETGTGKERAARSVHRHSPRAARSFLVLQGGAVPESLVESELFGHARGAFTGAAEPRRGLLELSDGGTLFLDEIGEMPLAAQTKLLRVLESSNVRRLGAEQDLRIDVRFVAATNRDLRKMVAEGRFREDLFYRLNVVSVQLPPLRHRKEDIPLLVQDYLKTSSLPGARECIVDARVVAAFQAYDWPGNIRELRNVLERALILSGGSIGPEHLPPELLQRSPSPTVAKSARLDLASVERAHILHVLELASGNKVEAARLLGVPRRTLYRRLERFGLT